MIPLDEIQVWLKHVNDNSPCEHCRARTTHFHQDGTGIIFGNRINPEAATAISLYHQGRAPLTDHDEDLPGYQWSQRGRGAA